MRTRKDIEDFEDQQLALYAMKSKDSVGRAFVEGDHPNRTCYQRDRDRIVHCEHFRKLEYKTQVFIIFEGDYYRTRLTHTIEVAQLARTIGRNLELNEDLIEAIALAHDLGHPPFGHAGEYALSDILKEAGFEGFNHNRRSYDIVTKFEKRYPEFDGLNLSKEVLDGILSHKTDYDVPGLIQEKGSTLEAQVVDVADSLAYLNHDIDDGLTSGCISENDLMGSQLWQRAYQKIEDIGRSSDQEMFKYQIVKELIDCQAIDLLQSTLLRIEKHNFQSVQDVKDCGEEYIVGFSDQMRKDRNELQEILCEKLYHHFRVERMTAKARRVIQALFQVYLENPKQLPYQVYERNHSYSQQELYQTICNHIASMTDRFALDEHKKLFDPYQKV